MSWLSKLFRLATKEDLELEIEIRNTLIMNLIEMIALNHKLILSNEDLIDSNFEVIDKLMGERKKKKKSKRNAKINY